MSFFLALGLGTRFAFIATLIPLVFYIIYVIYKRRLNKEIKNGLLDALKIFLIASFIVILFWAPVPAVLFKGSLDLFLNLFKHPWGYPYVLLNGEIYEARNVPFYYIFVNLFYKSPEYIIILYLIFILNFKNIFIFLLKLDKNIFSKQIFIIACLILPTILHIFNPFSVYDGLRLFLFLLPYFSIIPALVIFYLIKNYKIKICKIFLTINCALFAYFLYFFISLTPYHYSYINLFAGSYTNF
jgi:hypothetical protein